jgi:hypothetical protein
MRSFITRTFAKYNENDLIKEDKMSRGCSTHGGQEKWLSNFYGKFRRKETITKT